MSSGDTPTRITPNEPADAARNWERVAKKGTEIIPAYLSKMGYTKIAIIGYTDIAAKLIEQLKDSGITVSLYVDKGDTIPDTYAGIYNDIASMLNSTRSNLIIDTDYNKFLLRRVYYDRFNTESCLLSQLLMRMMTNELFNWYLADYPYQDEMLDDLMSILDDRYKNIALIGNSSFIVDIYKKYSPVKHGVIVHIPIENIRITDSGRRFDILGYDDTTFDAVVYIGVNSNVFFFQDNDKVELININSICQELAMSYDLATDVLPTLESKGIKVFTFLYPEIYTLNYMLRARGLPPFKRKPYLHVMAKDPNYAEDVKQFYKELYSPEYVQGILKRPSVVEVNGLRRYADFHTDYYNIVDGKRLTTHTPPETVHTVHFFGKCVAMGRYVEHGGIR